MKFTRSHEWIEIEADHSAIIGITPYAQKELGDIVYVELPKIGKEIQAGQQVVVLESTKAAADVYAPASGTITAVNESLQQMPELINQSADQEGWLFKMQLSQSAELDALMDKKAYEAMLSGT